MLDKDLPLDNIKSNVISICSTCNLSKIAIIVSEIKNITNIANNTLKILKNYNFSDYNIKNNTISFYVENDKKIGVLTDIAKKLHLLKNDFIEK